MQLRIRLFSPVVLLFAMSAPQIAAQPATPVILRDRPPIQRFPTAQPEAATTGLPSWTGSFTFRGRTYRYQMVGTDPAQGSRTTIIPVYIVPLKLTFSDGTVFDSSVNMINEPVSATQAVIASPVFQSAPFTAGDVDLGTTQYIDAFQRANFWNSVSVNTGYHVLLGNPTVLPVQSFIVPEDSGATFPGPVPPYRRASLGQKYINRTITPTIFKAFPQITASTFTIFLTYNVFPGESYGYHDVFGPSPATALTYAYVSYLWPYIDVMDADISTLAHEVAEWTDDPYIINQTPCGLLEVGDSLVNTIFEVNLNGIVWHPQDLAMVGYFYQQPVPSVNGWLTFRNTYNRPCENGLER